jgi:hypothetical protein
MIAWMIDIDTRATTKKREFQRTFQKLCLYIKHLEGESIIYPTTSYKQTLTLVRDHENQQDQTHSIYRR